ncbi:MAG: hypothetical protein AVO38_14230 [delta proteobacterium ML8_D]|nr:MAG: hypothetical protein AVO38_14230 [delta proteobacterium ML8_D]
MSANLTLNQVALEYCQINILLTTILIKKTSININSQALLDKGDVVIHIYMQKFDSNRRSQDICALV